MTETDKKMNKEQFLKEQARVKKEYDILIDNPKSLALFLENEKGPSSSTRLEDKKHKHRKHKDGNQQKQGHKHKQGHKQVHRHGHGHGHGHGHSHKEKQDNSQENKNNIKKIIEADPDSLIIEQPKLMVDIGHDHHHLKIGEKSINLKKVDIGSYLKYIEKYSKDKNEYKKACKIIATFLHKESRKFDKLAE